MFDIIQNYKPELKRMLTVFFILAVLLPVFFYRQAMLSWFVSNTGSSILLSLLMAIVLGLAIRVYYQTVIVRYKSGRL